MSVTFSSVSSPSALQATKAANTVAYAQFGSAHDRVQFGNKSSDAPASDKPGLMARIGTNAGNYFKFTRDEEGKRNIFTALLPWNVRNVYNNVLYATILTVATVGSGIVVAPFIPLAGLLLQVLFPKTMGPKAEDVQEELAPTDPAEAPAAETPVAVAETNDAAAETLKEAGAPDEKK